MNRFTLHCFASARYVVTPSEAKKADLVRHWKVVDADARGVATIEMSIASMRWERKAGNDEDVFDSSK